MSDVLPESRPQAMRPLFVAGGWPRNVRSRRTSQESQNRDESRCEHTTGQNCVHRLSGDSVGTATGPVAAKLVNYQVRFPHKSPHYRSSLIIHLAYQPRLILQCESQIVIPTGLATDVNGVLGQVLGYSTYPPKR
jgi:hypothetical protein